MNLEKATSEFITANVHNDPSLVKSVLNSLLDSPLRDETIQYAKLNSKNIKTIIKDLGEKEEADYLEVTKEWLKNWLEPAKPGQIEIEE